MSVFLRLENGGLVAVGGAHKVRDGYSRFASTLLSLSPVVAPGVTPTGGHRSPTGGLR